MRQLWAAGRVSATGWRRWVVMHDKALSGWGQAAGRRNFFAVACDTPEQVEAVQLAARGRPEMARVRVVPRAPSSTDFQLVSLRHFDELGGAWRQHYAPRE